MLSSIAFNILHVLRFLTQNLIIGKLWSPSKSSAALAILEGLDLVSQSISECGFGSHPVNVVATDSVGILPLQELSFTDFNREKPIILFVIGRWQTGTGTLLE